MKLLTQVTAMPLLTTHQEVKRAANPQNQALERRPEVGFPSVPEDVKRDLEQVSELLAAKLRSSVPAAEGVARYAVEGGGKRVRPLVLLLFARSLGAPTKRAVDLAAVAEWVHAASLLHDDVIDAADTRRGKPAAYLAFGVHAAVMGGDYLLARALEQLLCDGDADGAGRRLGEAVAKLAEGELLEACLRGDLTATREQVAAVADLKTAALLAWACQAGALAARVPLAVSDAARVYGMALGQAFQLADDALDYEDGPSTGKTTLTDLRAGLPTLPLLYAIEQRPALREQVRQFLEGETALAESIGAQVRELGGVSYTRGQARQAARRGISQLRQLPAGPHRAALARLAGYVARRWM